ncbi:MAG TPA: helix-turn-helix transcriptional regulator [Terriglobales bacterium]|nr:helix-turn-helix transcriptional regulator [Terriglobales bacterium]
MLSGGQKLRALREQLGLTMRDVENSSMRLATKHKNDEFSIPPSRLSDIETKGVIPSIYRLYALSVIYRRDLHEMLLWFGVDVDSVADDLALAAPPKSHFSQALANVSAVQAPVRIDPGFDARRTSNIGRLVEQWGLVPLSYLAQFANCEYTYGYIGSEDLTMYPLLPPGSFIQVDESKDQVEAGGWNSEYERPIYFVETRQGHVCCWCTLSGDHIILQSHPLSPVPPRVLRYPQEAEVVGQVIGAALRLGDWHPVGSVPASKERATLN